ncbi:3-oxoacyl-[acyl-carrier protein] reductase [Geomicrobium halophilum]|uniref:3-oxoacyl-[acyl-carrier protein] reductase n=1 Tax=Geomicrobium halophilum TaxID=549000 RepID=A0A841PK51_9BACL|nr:SDR family oxidoreductase [Geomicrobium halophilum]MBB6449160.1 3-oxoacyl-[acyl-carrier protein] reductase [Geomicrobium halophilum]
MNLRLQNKAALVLAGSKGLGRAIATELAREGANVIIASRDEEQLEKTAGEIRKETGGGDVQYALCDLTQAEDIKAAVQKTVDQYGSVDVLINNSGGPKAGGFEDVNADDWQHAYELNLLSYVRATEAVLPYMKKHQNGRIVNITSSSIKQALDGMVLSNTFRAGVLGLTKSLSSEYAGDNIFVNTVGPGRIATDRVASLDELKANKQGKDVAAVRKESEDNIPAGRYGNPEEFAKTVTFLASGANSYVTGEALLVDGGLVKAL